VTRLGIRAHKRKRRRASFRLENQLVRKGYKLIAGLDEVGRGAWAGPVVAAAAILPSSLSIGQIFDSKGLNHLQRAQLHNYVREFALTFGIGAASHQEINKLGLTKALRLAYLRALKQLKPQPDIVLLDGLPLKNFEYPHQAVVQGDRQSKCIAAASIIAKEYRDALMIRLSPRYSNYAFHEHKGYGTKRHQDALLVHGVSDIHRTNIQWIKKLQAADKPAPPAKQLSAIL
jgi:ribonuclease HII